MYNFFKQANSQLRLFAIIYMVFGLILCFFNKSILTMSARVIGGVLLAYGVYELYVYFMKRQTVSSVPLFTGVPCALIGGFMIFSPESLVAILPVFAGNNLVLNSVMQKKKALKLKDHGIENCIWKFIVSLVTLVVGVIILLRPIQTLAFILQLVGVCLIIEGVIMLINEHEVNKYIQ